MSVTHDHEKRRKSPPRQRLMSVEEFMSFQLGRPDEERWQLIEGVPFMMTPATNRHQRLCIRLANLLNDGLEKTLPDWIALTERGLIVPRVARFRPTADVAVVLDDDGGSYTDRFLLAAEILLPSNTEEHIEEKRVRYIQHPECLHVLVIEQHSADVTIWSRATGWESRRLTALKDAVELPELGLRFTLRSLYKGTPVART